MQELLLVDEIIALSCTSKIDLPDFLLELTEFLVNLSFDVVKGLKDKSF